MRLCPNAQLVINSGDRTLFIPKTPQGPDITDAGTTVSQAYNNFLLNNPGQNIIQGSIDKVQVAEINFPYDIPNVLTNFSDGLRFYYNELANYFDITLPEGFYTGDELAVGLNDEITTECGGQTPPITGADIPIVSYDAVNNSFSIRSSGAIEFFIYDRNLNDNGGINTSYQKSGTSMPKSLLGIMGFIPQLKPDDYGQKEFTYLNLVAPGVLTSNSAPLIFTQFIDIVSKALCGNVYITDGSTQRGGFRKDLLARLYISDETSSQSGFVYDAEGNPQVSIVGTRPFVIHRQFKNAKVIPNNLLNSLNTVDVQLLMDNGQPLPLTVRCPRNFQLTLNVFETDRTNTVNVASSGYGNY